jgi:hypothetical protein
VPSHKTVVYTFLSSGAQAATVNSASFDLSEYSELLVMIHVTVITDGAALDVTVHVSDDNVNWYTHSTVAQATAVSRSLAKVTNVGKFVRLNCAISGSSPSITFSAKGIAKT